MRRPAWVGRLSSQYGSSSPARGSLIEMEALVAASVAALTVYDMVKGVEKGVEIRHLRLVSKVGGKSGEWRREGLDLAQAAAAPAGPMAGFVPGSPPVTRPKGVRSLCTLGGEEAEGRAVGAHGEQRRCPKVSEAAGAEPGLFFRRFRAGGVAPCL